MNSKTNIPQQASQYAYTAIKDMIAHNVLVPGQKVTYDYLSKVLKISKTPIGMALSRLEQEDFVTSLPNRGFFLKSIYENEITDLYRLREALEVLAVEESIKNKTSALMKKLESASAGYDQFQLATPTRERLFLDAKYHLSIAEMSNNASLLKVLRQLFESLYFKYRLEWLLIDRFTNAKEQHHLILKEIKEGNVAKAASCMKDHIKSGRFATLKGVRLAKRKIGF